MFYNVIRFIVNIYMNIYYKFEVVGKENVPSDGSLIICSNHIHWADPVIVACKSTNRQIHYMAKIEIFKNNFITWFLNNLNVFSIKRGEIDVAAIKNALRLLKDGKVLGMFPEGTRVKGDEEKKPEAGLGMLAVKSKAIVVPVNLRGSYKFRSKITVTVGKPIYLEEYHSVKINKEGYEKISNDIMQTIRKLNLG